MTHARLAHSSCKPLALTKDLIAPAFLLQLATFLQHTASSLPDSSKMQHKYLNSDTHSNHFPSTRTSDSNPSSQFSNITFILPASTFRPLLLHTSTKSPTTALRSSSTHHTKPSHSHTRGQVISTLSPPPHPYFHLLPHCIVKGGGGGVWV